MTRVRSKLLRDVGELRGVVRLLAPYASGQLGAVIRGLLLTMLLLGLRLAQPWPLKWILDGLIGSGPEPMSPTWAAALFLGVSALAAATEYQQVTGLVAVGNHILYRFRADLFQHVLRQPLAFHERKAQGELLTRIVYDATRLRKGVNQILTRFFQTLLTFVATIGVLLWVDPFLGTVMGVSGVVVLLLMARGSRRVKKAARKSRRREGKLAALVADELLAIRDLQTFRPDAGGGHAFERNNAKSLSQEGKIRRLSSGLLLRVELIVSSAIALILFMGARRLAQGAISAGELVLFVSYATSLYKPFFRFTRQATRMGSTLAAAHRLQRLMQRTPEIVDRPDAVHLERIVGTIDFHDVSVRAGSRAQGTRRWALRGLTFAIPAGASVAVVGANGAGKSTLLRAILRLSQPKSGEVTIDDQPLDRFTRSSLRGRMSVVFQGSVFFGMSVRENLVLGRPAATDEDIDETLRRVGARELVDQLSDGLDTVLTKGGRLISEGEAQRLAVARALLTDGDIWLLDEPTTGLDVEGSTMIVSALQQATRGRTTFWVTHDPRVVAQLDRILILTRGELAFLGSQAEFRDAVAHDPAAFPPSTIQVEEEVT